MKNKKKFSKAFSIITILSMIIQLFIGAAPAFAAIGNSDYKAANQTMTNSGVASPDNGWLSDNQYANFDNKDDYVVYGLPNLDIPVGATIEGIEVTIEGKTTGRDLSASLWNMSNSNPDSYTSSQTAVLISSDSVKTLGGNTSKWGKAWAVSDFTDTDFKIRVDAENGNGTTAQLDQLRVKVYYSTPSNINASSSAGGIISPAGVVSVVNGANQTFTIMPNTGYIVADVVIDAVSQGRVNSYTFNNVTADHTISASFESGWTAPTGTNNNNNVSNPSNIYASNNSYAVFNNSSDRVDYTNFGLSVPTGARVDGIEVAVEGNRNSGRTLDAYISWDAGVTYTSAKNLSAFTNSDSTFIAGSNTDKWGRISTWNYSDFSNTNFRLRIASTTGSGDINVDQIQVKVYYTADVTPPVISLTGDEIVNIEYKDTYSEQGATWTDDFDGSGNATIGGDTVDTSTLGTYVITYNKTDNAGNNATQVIRTINVIARKITVTADSQTKVYGETDPELSYQVTGNLMDSDSWSGALNRANGESVADYAISQGTLALNSNYNITFVPTNLTITKAPISVKANNATKIYGEANPAFSGIITGTIAGDTITATYSSAATATSPIGEYDITTLLSGTALTNYETPAMTNGTLTITSAPITITADNKTKVIDTADPALTYKITSGALVGTDKFTGFLDRPTGEDEGSYLIRIGTLALSSNYNLIFNSGIFNITAKPVVVPATTPTNNGSVLAADTSGEASDNNGIILGTESEDNSDQIAQETDSTSTTKSESKDDKKSVNWFTEKPVFDVYNGVWLLIAAIAAGGGIWWIVSKRREE